MEASFFIIETNQKLEVFRVCEYYFILPNFLIILKVQKSGTIYRSTENNMQQTRLKLTSFTSKKKVNQILVLYFQFEFKILPIVSGFP